MLNQTFTHYSMAAAAFVGCLHERNEIHFMLHQCHPVVVTSTAVALQTSQISGLVGRIRQVPLYTHMLEGVE